MRPISAATRPTIKICGLTEDTAVNAAIDAGADMVGFVVCARSPRHLGYAHAARLAAVAGGRAERVLLTVDADDATMEAACAAVRPHWLQFHGSETPARVAHLRARFDVRVMRAIAVRSIEDLERARSFATICDRLLFDAPPPEGVDRPGGNGTRFDWSMLAGIDLPCPWMLAGGLDADNVGEALRVTKAPGVDVSSGVESAPGVKDAGKIAAFVAAARRPHGRPGPASASRSPLPDRG